MLNPIGWAVLARTGTAQIIEVVGLMDFRGASNESRAIEAAKRKLREDYSGWRFAAFGVMRPGAEDITRQNCAAALQKLGLHGFDPEEAYSNFLNQVRRYARIGDSA